MDLTFLENLQTKILSFAFFVVKELTRFHFVSGIKISAYYQAEFVNANDLQQGDVIIFEPVESMYIRFHSFCST